MSGNVKVFDPNTETVNALCTDFPVIEKAETVADVAAQQLVFIAVHPPVVMETLQAIKELVNASTVVISLAPKITLEKMAAVLPTQKLVRMIPNATSFINEGYNPVTFAPGFVDQDKKKLLKLLKKLGENLRDRRSKAGKLCHQLGHVAYLFLVSVAGNGGDSQRNRLKRRGSRLTVSTTLKKAWKLYYQSGLQANEVMDLIPVKPIDENEPEIRNILNTKLLGLFGKIKP